MTELATFLEAKQSLDRVSRHQPTWERFCKEISQLDRLPLLIYEPGCGTGSMLDAYLAMEELVHTSVLAFDITPELVTRAQSRVLERAEAHHFDVTVEGNEFLLRKGDRTLRVEYRVLDLLDLMDTPSTLPQADVLVAHALLDLFPLPHSVPHLLALIRPGGLMYAPITFNGITEFLPLLDRSLDEEIVAIYHESMVRQDRKGNASNAMHAGRDLVKGLLAAGAILLESGPSDWVVSPEDRLEEYQRRIVLSTLLGYVEKEVNASGTLDEVRFQEWLRMRRRQLEQNELYFRAHNLDVLARSPA